MPPVHSLRGQSTTVPRRLALMGAALASAIALLSGHHDRRRQRGDTADVDREVRKQLQQAHLRRHWQGQQRHVR
jgi:hypothetical protein